MVHISVALMLKNEEKRLSVTLNSLVDYINSLVVYDTGSTDSTIEILHTFSEMHNIPLYLKQGEFVNFSSSRNVLLDFANTIDGIDYLLLLDCNDELRNGEVLLGYCKNNLKSPITAWYLKQEWFCGGITLNYLNIRLIRPRSNWFYKGVVHEYLTNTIQDLETHSPNIDGVVLFQDRTQDDDKSTKRLEQDKRMLVEEYRRNPTDPRTVFYLAQTCSCMGSLKEAYDYYKIRTGMQGFTDEIFHCWLRMGTIAKELKYDWDTILMNYMKALEHSVRVEPLVCISVHYINNKNWELAYHFLKIACSLKDPLTTLFVDREMYNYTRYHLMSLAAYYCGQLQEGYDACKMAIRMADKEVDKANLKFYLDKLKLKE